MVTLDQGGAGRREARVRPAGPDLRHLVEHSCVLRPRPAGNATAWRIVPDEAPHLLCQRFDDGRTRTRLVGARSRFLDVDRRGRVSTVGVRLRAGALRALFNVDAWELRDGSARLEEVAGQAGLDLTERLAGEADPGEVERTLLAFVARRGATGARDWRIRGFLAHTDEPRVTVRDASSRLGVSERALRDVCRAEVGLRPKEVQRIRRLHRALARGLGGGSSECEVASRSGYADQAHMIRESRALLGATPFEFRARGRAVSSNTVPHASA